MVLALVEKSADLSADERVQVSFINFAILDVVTSIASGECDCVKP